MKPAHLAIVAALAFFVWKRRKAKTTTAPGASVGQLSEGAIMDGTNWTSNAWTQFETAADNKNPATPNLTGSTIADPGKVGQAQLGLATAWNGNLL